MKIAPKALSVTSLLVFTALFLANAVSALAQIPALYGNRTIRLTSKCGSGLPDVPPPTVQDINCNTVPTIAQSPSARWSVDISWFDPVFQKFYLADRNNFGVDVIDTTTEQMIGTTGGFVGTNCTLNAGTPDCTVLPAPPANSAGPNGVLTTHEPDQLWAGDGDGTVKVFSLDAEGVPTALLKTVTVTNPTTHADAIRRADEMAYDPDHELVLVAWDDDADLFLAFITVSANPKVVGTIAVPEAAGCGIEQPVYDHHLKLFFLAIPCTSAINKANHNTAIHANGEIAVIDPKKMKIQGVFALDGTNCFPHGLTLGPRDELLLGCSGDGPAGSQLSTIIMSALDGAKLQTFTTLGGSDEVWYNPGDNRYYLAMSSWTSTGLIGGTAKPSLGIIDAGSTEGGALFIQNIPTTRTSHTLAAVYDCQRPTGKCKPINNRVFVPLTVQTGSATVALDSGGIGVYGVIP
jgi:hypothetical protein